MFYGMAVGSGYPHRGNPFMVGLVDMLVELGMMKQPVKKEGRKRKWDRMRALFVFTKSCKCSHPIDQSRG